MPLFEGEIMDSPRVDYPRSGETIQGQVVISGRTEVEGFLYSEVFFGYAEVGDNEWFFISRQEQPIRNGVISSWDTFTISDGVYNLRILIHLQDGKVIEMIVNNLEVNNYSNVNSDRLAESTFAPGNTSQSTTTLTRKTATPSPANPAEIDQKKYMQVVFQGLLITFVSFIVFGIYIGIRKLSRS